MPGGQTERVLEERGRPLEVGADKPFLFADSGGWYVRSGNVDVFSVRVEEGCAVGARSHFFRAKPGQFLFGFGEAQDRPMGLLAVGTSGTQLIRVEEDELRRLAGNSNYAAAVASWVEEWVDILCSSISNGPPLDECLSLEPGELVGSEDEVVQVRPTKRTLWIRAEDGDLRLLGRQGLELGDEGFTPISPRAWLEVPAHGRIQAEESQALIGREEMWSGLGRLHDLVLDYVVQRSAQAAAEERERLRQKAAADRLAFEEACSLIAETLDGEAREVPRGPADDLSEKDALVAACAQLADELDIELKPLPAAEGPIRREPLAALAHASKFRTRQVLLRGGWWKTDGAPMLGYLKEPRRPVVLLPRQSGYLMRDPVERTEVRVKEDVAELLEPTAHTIYRPFHERALSLPDLVRFGLRGSGRDLANILLMGSAAGLLGLATPIFTGMIFNDVIPSADRLQLVQLMAIMLVIAVATLLFKVSNAIALVRIDGRLGAGIQSAVWDRLLGLPMPFFRRYTAGDLANRAMGIDSIRQVLSGTVVTAVLSGLFSTLHFGLLFHYSEKLAWWATFLIGLAVLATLITGRVRLRFDRATASVRTKLSGSVLQFLSSISKLRVAGAEIKAFFVWARGFSRQRRHRFKSRLVDNVLAAFNAGFPLASQVVIFGLAMELLTATTDPLPTGDFLAFMASYTLCMTGLLGASTALLGAAMVIPMYEQAQPILREEPEVDSGKVDPGTMSGAIEVQNVKFRYHSDGPLVLRDVKLHVRPGEFIALVGPSGSGKSTVLRLLLGFEEPESGGIYYDGQDLASLDAQAVRAQIGVVLQNGRLMPGDIFTNIVGSSMATIDDAWEAARMAGLDADIEAMPMGMHTIVSQGGGTLSGGQRQRLMIARALVRKPKLLLFDEATSALDNRTQQIVTDSLDLMQASRIVVAHRLSTILYADRIYVLESGRVVQTGNYDELLEREGPFRELAQRQIA